MFLNHSATGITVLLIYVDDIIIIGIDFEMIKDLQVSLHKSCHMKDLGPLTYFLGLEVHQSEKGLIPDQHKYNLDLIDIAGLLHSTLVEVNLKLHHESGDLLPNPTLYR